MDLGLLLQRLFNKPLLKLIETQASCACIKATPAAVAPHHLKPCRYYQTPESLPPREHPPPHHKQNRCLVGGHFCLYCHRGEDLAPALALAPAPAAAPAPALARAPAAALALAAALAVAPDLLLLLLLLLLLILHSPNSKQV